MHSLLAQQHAQAARPGPVPRAHAAHLPPAPARPCRSGRARLRAPRGLLRASWPYHGLAGHCIAIQSSLASTPQSQYTSLYCDTTLAFPAFSCNTILCIAIHCLNSLTLAIHSYNTISALKPSSLQYKNCIAIQFFFFFNTLSTCNTLYPLAIQLAVAQSNFSAPLFFFVFHSNFFFSSLLLEKPKNIYNHHFFFHLFLVVGKLQKKIYTYFFSSFSIIPK